MDGMSKTQQTVDHPGITGYMENTRGNNKDSDFCVWIQQGFNWEPLLFV